MKVIPEQWLTAIGLTFAATVFIPAVKRTIRETQSVPPEEMVKAQLSQQQIRQRLALVREGFEDFAAEVQYERLRKRALRR